MRNRVRTAAVAACLCSLALAAPAQALPHGTGRAGLASSNAEHLTLPAASCPPHVAVQTTVRRRQRHRRPPHRCAAHQAPPPTTCVAFDANGRREPCPPPPTWTPAQLAALSAAQQVPGPYQAISVVNAAGVDPAALTDWENAERIQLNLQVAPLWGTLPITFSDSPGAWQLSLDSRAGVDAECPATSDGCHHLSPSPSAYALADPTMSEPSSWEYAASHELIEMLVDPSGGRPEVCDPLAWDLSTIADATVAQFVTPTGESVSGFN